uniref:Tc1-like transposase DDE domain-containing protein n=1 Tax=Oncorhynchus tshawytscha TaxID=74940 RepID=A0AAZ3RAC0_ONCTS
MEQSTEKSLMKTCSRALRTSDWDKGSPANRTSQEWLWDKSLNVLEWPSQSPDMNPIKHFCRDLKIAVQRCSPSNLTELKRICRKEWEKLPKYRCAKLVTSYPRRLQQSTEYLQYQSKVWTPTFKGFYFYYFLHCRIIEDQL